ncbi:MAG: hypothetical protein SOR61_03515 [Evtepia sp.]|uniref:hypothetical protein n=1 Tax=Evtepia sp. TaxID=2773933 RepID=UPI002A75B96A|nr:hypothetical protein [Evtepia sp.]MDY3014252.1 hypothetical protein [Evtepia sp.]
MIKRILSFVMTAIMLAAFFPVAMAATTDHLNQPEVFLKQQQRGTCTLASTAMMLRRTAMLRGDEDWAEITEASCREAFWLSCRGLPYHFSYDGMNVSKEKLPGGEANRQILIDLLTEHPEGIVLHASCVPHGILLTDYTDGVFYCADPAQDYPEGRIPVEQAYGTRIENSNGYWYVETPDVAVEASVPEVDAAQQPALPAPVHHEQPVKASLALLLPESVQEETVAVFFGLPMLQPGL